MKKYRNAKRKSKRFVNKLALLLGVILLSFGVLTACAAPVAHDSAPAMAPPTVTEEAWEVDFAADRAREAFVLGVAGGTVAQGSEIQASTEEHPVALSEFLIHTAWLHVITVDFDDSVATLMAQMNQAGGFIENSSIEGAADSGPNRWANFVIRVPAGNYQGLLNNIEEIGRITSISTDVTNVSASFADIDSRLTSLRTQEGRILDLIETAESMEDLILLETNLAEVIRQIEVLTTDRGNLQTQVDLSTITVSLQEVNDLEEAQVGFVATMTTPNAGLILMNSLRSMGNFFVVLFMILLAVLPWAILVGGILLIILKVIRPRVRASRAKRGILSGKEKRLQRRAFHMQQMQQAGQGQQTYHAQDFAQMGENRTAGTAPVNEIKQNHVVVEEAGGDNQ